MELLSVTMTEGVKKRSELDGKDNSSEDKSNYKLVRAGDMVYNSMRMWQGASGISTIDGIVSPAYTVLTSRHAIANGFFAALFKSHNTIGKFRRYSQGMTSDTWNLKYPQIAPISISIPSLDEQEKIATFLEIFDKRIMKQKQYVEYLKSYKRGVIETYFSRKINLFSRHNATGSCWEIKRLEDVTSEFKSGKSIPTSEINSEGQYAVFGGNGIRGYTDHYSHDGQYVVVGRQGALCGNVRLVDGRNYLSEHAIAVKASEGNFTPFLLYLLDHMRLGQYSDQGAQPGLAVNKLVKLQHHFPSYEEQVTAATFFMKLDNRIETGNHLLSLLSSFKKGMLQAMFP